MRVQISTKRSKFKNFCHLINKIKTKCNKIKKINKRKKSKTMKLSKTKKIIISKKILKFNKIKQKD